MLKKDDFISFILDGQKQTIKKSPAAVPAPTASDLMSLGFDIPATSTEMAADESSFAQKLLEASDFGKPEYVQTASLIRSTDSVAQHLPPRAAYWPKTPSRPYQTLLFETDKSHKDLLAIPAFKSRKMSHLDMVEDALARMVSEALEGFQRGGDSVTADVRKGKKEETLCIVSVKDEREQLQVRLVCFGTVNAKSNGLETFHLTEQTRYWDQQLAKDHLGLLYERQFKKLGTATWQEAFTTSEERKQAEKLLEVCSKKSPQKAEIEENIINLLDTIAKNFGLRCKAGQTRRLQAFNLPSDHDIGIDPEEISKHGGMNPFGGVTLRDEKNRLLGYIVYPLKKKEDAAELRSYLAKNNRFHNVLVVFPDGDETTLELWQGADQLSGKLRKDQGFHGAAEVVSLLSRFFVVSKAKVRNPSELAQELAYRARYLRRLAIKELDFEKEEGPIRNLYKAFREALVHDQTESDFADAFAQTLTYGLLTARWIGNDKLADAGDRFTRLNALKYLPSTSNFLGDLFKTALSVKLNDQRGRLLWLVDDIADLLDRIDVTYVFGLGDKDSDQATDPIIHFYEPFLAAYDNELRNKRGVYFTPRPVVSCIIRNVHELLQTEFGIEDGLASTVTWGAMQNIFPDLKLPDNVKASDSFICILDPATGTGTFLYECIEVIERTMKDKWCKELNKENWNDIEIISRWQEYVSKHLLSRLYGYELMMASYSVAHLKLAFKLEKTGYKISENDRIHVYLTNTLEQPSNVQIELSGVVPSLAREAREVNEVKRSKNFTVVTGNPPYAYASANSGEWISTLIRDYYEADGKPLGERNPRGLQDDYVKFIRYGQSCITKSTIGLMSYISNNGYMDNSTFRGMRQNLIKSFSKLIFLDLHGNSKKKEVSPDGSKDENVFDIQAGVAINYLIKKQPYSGAKVYQAQVWGDRQTKYLYLDTFTSNQKNNLIKLTPSSPYYLFVTEDDDAKLVYERWSFVQDIFPTYSSGMNTLRDGLVIAFDKEELFRVIDDFLDTNNNDEYIREKYQIKDSRDWKLSVCRKSAKLEGRKKLRESICQCLYRPFDKRYILLNEAFVGYPRYETTTHFMNEKSVGFATTRQTQAEFSSLASRVPFGQHKIVDPYDRSYVFPIYLFPDTIKQKSLELSNSWPINPDGSIPNISAVYVAKLESLLGATFSSQERNGSKCNDVFTTEDIFHFIYAIFHSIGYRNIYQKFLKIDFPRIPVVSNLQLFCELCLIGKELVSLHIMESSKLQKLITKFIPSDDTEVNKITFKNGTIWFNKRQTAGIANVTEQVWNFHIGGYQVCEKWIKDRKGRTLSDDDIAHYQKIIVAINETIQLMEEIDKVIDEHGGWPSAFQSSSGANA